MKISWRQKIFARLWFGRAQAADEALRAIKAPLFSGARGTVVEIGPGTGANFRYFPAGISWIGIEPVHKWHALLCAHPKRPEKMSFVNALADIPTGSVDTVVSSLVLCSVPDVHETVAEVRRVLKVGGTLLSVEHVGASRGSLRRILQHLIHPLTKLFGGGCNPVRDIGETITQAGFSDVSITKHEAPLGLPIRVPVIACRARK